MALHSNITRRFRKPSFSTVLMMSLLLVGAAVIAYPTFADWWNSYHQHRAISDYVRVVEEADETTIDAMLEEARRYNVRLTYNVNRFSMSDAELEEYRSVLNPTGSGIMGYVQVPKIGISYPIYHGVEERTLQTSIGHLEGTSLPVGGPSTHAAVTGHRGLPSAKLFSDLDKLREGDLFTVTVLTQTIAYEVDQIRIVEPEDMSALNIEKDEDYMTLVTCTPYGVNTHRLLVRGHRTDGVSRIQAIPAEAVQIPNYIAVPAVGIPMLFTYLAVTLLADRGSRRHHKVDREKALQELRGGDARDGDKT